MKTDEEEEEEYEELSPSLQNILDQTSLQWVFVGGKGGVGKTTTACALATQLAKVRKSVLLMSTDPAHNLSDAFGQHVGRQETKINGFDNLYAVEIDPAHQAATMADLFHSSQSDLISELMGAVPGIDEAVSFAELMRQVQKMQYDVIVFDTAPTGHTLRLLGFPGVMETAISKLMGFQDRFSGIFTQISSAVNKNAQASPEQVISQVEEMRRTIQYVNRQFKDPNVTTFVCVCIPEFLSLFETERLVQQLAKFKIDTHCLVVNQVLFPEKGSNCKKCASRVRMQQKYLEQIGDLYEDFNIVTMPLLDAEVRGTAALLEFSEHLMSPFDPEASSSSSSS